MRPPGKKALINSAMRAERMAAAWRAAGGSDALEQASALERDAENFRRTAAETPFVSTAPGPVRSYPEKATKINSVCVTCGGTNFMPIGICRPCTDEQIIKWLVNNENWQPTNTYRPEPVKPRRPKKHKPRVKSYIARWLTNHGLKQFRHVRRDL